MISLALSTFTWACLGWLGGVARAAEGDDPTWYVGLTVAEVQLQAPEGGLPDESLDSLLRSVAGRPLDPAAVRLDLATLFRVGEFAAVEAELEPWFAYDSQGRAQEAVLLTYLVYPSPRVERISVQGEGPIARRRVLQASGLDRGQTWFPGLDDPAIAERVRTYLHRQGYTRADVRVVAIPADPGRSDRAAPPGAEAGSGDQTSTSTSSHVDLVVDITLGEPNILERLTFVGELDEALERRDHALLRRWARRAGVEEGEPFAPEALTRATQEIRTRLASLRQGPFRRPRGWIGARVGSMVEAGGNDGARVTYTVELGPRLVVEASGLGLRSRHKAREALDIDERLRLTRGFLDEAPGRVERWLQNRGWLEAEARVALEEAPEGAQILRVEADRGARHRLRSGAPPSWVGIDFDGNEALSDAELQRVVDQASPDVVRRDIYTRPELEEGLKACVDLYRARGFQQADLRLGDVEVRQRRAGPTLWLGAPLRWLTGREPRRKVLPTVLVDEGPLTRLSGVQLTGAAADVDVSAIEKELQALSGQPYSPQALERLSREVTAAHREAGYLGADSRVTVDHGEPLVENAAIEVVPGSKVLLRSVVIRGNTETGSAFLRREVGLEVGTPLRSSDLERVRSDLYELGIFRGVSLDLLGDGDQTDLVVSVTERPRWAYEVGAGLSTDQGIRTFGRVSRRNLWGRAHRADLVGQIGLGYRSDTIQDWTPDLTNPDWRLALSYTAPRFPTRQQESTLDLLLREQRQERTWRMARTGGGAAVDTRIGNRASVRGAARLETRQLQAVDPGALLAGEPWTSESLLADDGETRRWRVQEALTGLVVYDLRNDPVSPTSGLLASANAEWVPGLIDWRALRDQPVTAFLKGEARLSAYVPVLGFVLRLSGEGGRAASLNRGLIPLEDRFRLGGTGSLRGFIRDAVGPRNKVSRANIAFPDAIAPLVDYSVRDDPERWVPTGGDGTAVGVAELVMPLPALGLPGWDGYALALFADAGQVWLSEAGGRATSERAAIHDLVPPVRLGTGGGLRVATPVGPLQLDIAANPQAIASGSPATRTLLVDTWEEPKWRAHLTLGATF